jgi:aryl-alcohol dehydrogenase-like predicted oxidoreductase
LIRGRRDQFQILTKVGIRWDDPKEHGQVLFKTRTHDGVLRTFRRNSRPDSVRLEVDRSLRRIGVEVLDLVQVHRLDPDTPIAETMGALADLCRSGKVRAVGVSNYSAAELRRAQRELGEVPLASQQIGCSLLGRGTEREVLPCARELGVGVLAYRPLAEGMLSERFDPNRLPPTDVRRVSPLAQPINHARIQAAIAKTLVPIAERHGATVAQVALAWVLAQPGVSAAVVGARSPDQARQNAAAADLVLDPHEVAQLHAAFSLLRLDPLAGKGASQRVAHQARRVLKGVLRRLFER